MKKRFVCMALVLILLLPALASAQALPDISYYAKGSFSKQYAVYSGPGTNYYRANSGKATYGGGVARIFGVEGNWLLIGYQMTNGNYRIGYIDADALNYLNYLEGTISNLSFSGTTMYAVEKCGLTDDPVMSAQSIYTLAKGQAVTALAQMGSRTYVELMGSSSRIRGFVYSANLVTDPTATAVPSKPTAAPYYPTVTTPPYYPTVTTPPAQTGNALLRSLSHNCPNTGVMLPSYFSPYQTTYLLTVADWVSRVKFTPTAQDYNATIRVNGQYVTSGRESQVINMTDKPQAVTIQVTSGSNTTTYTIYLQRRPSERRTRVSAGSINNIYQSGNEWRIDADLGTVKYLGEDYNSGNYSTYTNQSIDRNEYDYVVSPNCIFYYGNKNNCYRAYTIQEFKNYYYSYGNLYTFIYIEDEIVAIFPYEADYY